MSNWNSNCFWMMIFKTDSLVKAGARGRKTLAASYGKMSAADKPGLKGCSLYISPMSLAQLKEPRKKKNADCPRLSHAQANDSTDEVARGPGDGSRAHSVPPTGSGSSEG